MDIILATLKEQGRSQRWLAAQLGIDESYIPKYRSGRLTPSPDILARAAQLLGLPASLVLAQSEREAANVA